MFVRISSSIVRNVWPKGQQIRCVHKFRRYVRPSAGEPYESKLIVGPFIRESRKNKEPRYPADFIYHHLGNTDTVKPPPMTLILIKHVEELGVPGDIVTVDIYRARFELLSAQLAVYASPYNLEKYKHLIESDDKTERGPSSAFVMTTFRKLAKEVIPVEMNDSEEWTIEKWHIRVALRKKGYVVPMDAIEMPKTPICGPDVDGLQGKDFAVILTLNGKEKVAVRCTVHHKNVQLKSNWFRAPRFAILPEEQSELLATMPVQESLPEDEEEEEEEFVS